MPLFGGFGAASARGLGLGNGEAPRVPTSVSVTAGVITITATYTITVSTFPLSRVEYRIARGGDAGRYTGSLPGANGSNSSGTISARVTAAGATENLVHDTTYTIFFRAVDASGQISPETAGDEFTTGAEVAPTAATPVISSSEVSYPTTPFLSFAWGAGTAGTYPIGLREYSVVAGNNPGAGTYNTLSGTSGTSAEIRYTSSGAAILAQTQYTVYFRYTSTSPTEPAGEDTAHAVHTTANEIPPSAPNSANLRRDTANHTTERSQLILSPGTITNAPTYDYKFQYALTTSNPPTTFIDWPGGKSSTERTVGVDTNGNVIAAGTTYYLRFKSVSLPLSGGTQTQSAPTTVASVTTRANVPPAPTLAWSGMSGSSYGNPTFSLTSSGGTTSSMSIIENGVGTIASGLSAGTHTITRNYSSNGSTKTYYAVAVNVDGDSSSASGTRTWVLPAKNQTYSEKPQGTAEYQLAATNSALDGCSPSYFGIVHSSIPASDDVPGYKRVDYYGFQIKSGNDPDGAGPLFGFSNTVSTYLFWTDPAGTKTASLSANTDASYSLRYEYLGLGGSSLNGEIKINFLWSAGGETGSAARKYSAFCVANGNNYFFAKEFYVEGVQTKLGSVS